MHGFMVFGFAGHLSAVGGLARVARTARARGQLRSARDFFHVGRGGPARPGAQFRVPRQALTIIRMALCFNSCLTFGMATHALANPQFT